MLYPLGLIQPLLAANPNLLTLLLPPDQQGFGMVPQPPIAIQQPLNVQPPHNVIEVLNTQVNAEQERVNNEADKFITGTGGFIK